MTPIKTLTAAIALSFAFQAAADVSNIKPLNSIALEVNSSIITYKDVSRFVKELQSKKVNKGIPEAQLVQAAKTRLLERALLSDAARQQGLKVNQEAIDTEITRRAKEANITEEALYAKEAANGFAKSQYRMEVAKDLLIEHMMTSMNSDVKISDKAVDDALAAGGNLPVGEPYTVYTIRRIIVNADSQENMLAVGQRMAQFMDAIAHGRDFGAIAKRYSQEPEAANGGVHDNITDGMLPDNVEAMLHQLDIKQATVPLRAGTTWQIIQLLGKRTETDPVKMQREAVRKMLVRQAQQESQAQFVAQMQQNAVIREY
ncbi:peptidylprolyl isomerase [Kingella negevensis]|uniref:peptidylprolyl isomerase n=1 Tax=Kingella negevensis TaxID=1522312 RepID=UPI00050A0B67|nr:SurA N-terminal domain-containing protein [Kingella negevensis]